MASTMKTTPREPQGPLLHDDAVRAIAYGVPGLLSLPWPITWFVIGDVVGVLAGALLAALVGPLLGHLVLAPWAKERGLREPHHAFVAASWVLGLFGGWTMLVAFANVLGPTPFKN